MPCLPTKLLFCTGGAGGTVAVQLMPLKWLMPEKHSGVLLVRFPVELLREKVAGDDLGAARLAGTSGGALASRLLALLVLIAYRD